MSQSQLYEWIKASEKLPEPLMDIYFRINDMPYVGFWNDHHKQFYSIRSGFEGYIIKPLSDIEWLSPVSTDEKLGADDMMTLAVDEPIILTRLDVPIIRDDRESGSRQHSPDGDSGFQKQQTNYEKGK